jgi:electron transfer flavoprotein alpha subunit
MAIIVLADHNNQNLSATCAKVVTAALAISGDVDVLVAGLNCAQVAEQAARIAGVRTVLVADHPALELRLAEQTGSVLLGLASDYDVFVSSTSTTGKDVLPRVAALLDVAQVSDIVSVVAADTFNRPIYAGNAVETLRMLDAKKVITVRASSFAAADSQPATTITPLNLGAELFSPTTVVGRETSQSARPDLSSAPIVVSGGRAFGSREQFEALVIPLADALNAAVGASRAAVDAGYASNDLQVGQTGAIVAPNLYIACGISGAVQHTAGMKDSRVIVAINSDAEAPIFQIADYGLVADIFSALPQLTALVETNRG